MDENDYGLTRSSVIDSLIQGYIEAEAKAEHYKHRHLGGWYEGRLDGLRTALLLLTDAGSRADVDELVLRYRSASEARPAA